MTDSASHSVSTRTPDTFSAAQSAPIGIDIGGTKINAAVIRPDMRTRDEHISGLLNSPTPADDPKAFLDTLVRMIQHLQSEHKVSAVGIATAGVVDSVTGQILGSTGNLPALSQIANLKKLLEDRVQLKVHVENDANAAAYGEFRSGAAYGARNAFAITLGTGVGMGLIIDGRMYRGSHFFAGEGGHIAIEHQQNRQCTCGRWGCWEAFGSGRGLEITAREMLAQASAEARTAFTQQYAIEGKVTTYSVVAALKDQHPLGLQIIEAWHYHVATGLGSLINVLDPDIVVVGGGLAQFVDFNRLRELTDVRAMGRSYKLMPAELGNLAGIVGAAYLALESLNDASSAG